MSFYTMQHAELKGGNWIETLVLCLCSKKNPWVRNVELYGKTIAYKEMAWALYKFSPIPIFYGIVFELAWLSVQGTKDGLLKDRNKNNKLENPLSNANSESSLIPLES
jgi:hypothetical protein